MHMSGSKQWHPEWHKGEYADGWERVKEAVRRDWQQTEHDLHLGGHELNQGASDTMKQAAGKAPIPSINQANPPKVIGDMSGEWERVEPPVAYGYSARQHFGDKGWDDGLEGDLRREWESPANAASGDWEQVRRFIRYGYSYDKKS
jgi:hypothetical protein